jgi:hypothetical protein
VTAATVFVRVEPPGFCSRLIVYAAANARRFGVAVRRKQQQVGVRAVALAFVRAGVAAHEAGIRHASTGQSGI